MCGSPGLRDPRDLRDPLSSSGLGVQQECPEEVFLEGLLTPCLEQGRLGALLGLLEGLDPGLEASGRYLMASCQFLQRRSYYNTLYQLQQFMMVRNGGRLVLRPWRAAHTGSHVHSDRITCERP